MTRWHSGQEGAGARLRPSGSGPHRRASAAARPSAARVGPANAPYVAIQYAEPPGENLNGFGSARERPVCASVWVRRARFRTCASRWAQVGASPEAGASPAGRRGARRALCRREPGAPCAGASRAREPRGILGAEERARASHARATRRLLGRPWRRLPRRGGLSARGRAESWAWRPTFAPRPRPRDRPASPNWTLSAGAQDPGILGSSAQRSFSWHADNKSALDSLVPSP